MGFLEAMEKIEPYIFQIEVPTRKVGFTTRLVWTGLILVLYLIMGYIPLYGIAREQGADPWAAMRIIIGGQQGSLLHLGIGPIVTGSLLVQLLAGSGLVRFDPASEYDRRMMQVATKLFTMALIIFSAVSTVFSGTLITEDIRARLIATVQLFLSSLLLLMMDEILQKGWGLGSGISLFILVGVAKEIWLECLSPLAHAPDGYMWGVLIFFFQKIFTLSNPFTDFFYRGAPNVPTLFQLFLTILFILMLLYLESVSINIPISHGRFRGFTRGFPIKLLYVSNIPVILTAAIFSNIIMIATFLSNTPLAETPLGDIIGRVQIVNNTYIPVSGLAKLVSAPRGIMHAIEEPFHALGYILILTLFSLGLSMVWLSVSGMDARSISTQLAESDIFLRGFRSTPSVIESKIAPYINTVALVGGLLIGLISGVGDVLGVLGGGMGVLLAVDIVQQYYQLILRETLETHPGLAKFLGG
ncbi:MAG: preprotein translocase subunit SecY [Crenarchaeota archaeon]|nr:preprotein translocase subunit SecY [Thermoproteota archaeon]MDW8033929.1 preprotein translocase subunit SecY [Nitrososphaerota archaeon]